MQRLLRLSVLFATFYLATTVVAQVAEDGAARIPQDAYAQIGLADIVILGEIHDNAHHHRGQALIVNALRPKAVVFEMLTPSQATQVSLWASEDVAALGRAIGWEAAGWPDFTLYVPIFDALHDASVVGAAAPRGTVRGAFSEGAAAVFGAGADRFGLDVIPPADQFETRKQMQFDVHCEAMPIEMMGGMVEAQRLRDALFADAALEALAEYGAPVVVIVGNGHARHDWGIPAMIATAAPDVKTLSVGFVEVPSLDNDPRFDITLSTARAPRTDPCARFRSN